MKINKFWYDDERFWKSAEPILFTKQRRSDAQSEVTKIIRLLNIGEKDRILDLCCGIGRHSLEFARRRYTVTAVDKTSLYLKKAVRQVKTEKLSVNFIQSDMRDFCQPDNFHIVLNIFSSYGYFSEEENVKVLKNIHRSLKPGGRLLLDIMGKEVIKRIFQTRDWLEEDGIFLLEERRLSPDEKRIESRWIIINQEKSFETKISLRIYSKSEIRDLLKSCGFSKVKICGDLDGNSYDKNSSRLVVIGYKDNQ